MSPQHLDTSQIWLSLLKTFIPTEGDKQENLILKCWTNGPHQINLYVDAVTAVCPPHGSMQLHNIATQQP
jgi:hypothetical protein